MPLYILRVGIHMDVRLCEIVNESSDFRAVKMLSHIPHTVNEVIFMKNYRLKFNNFKKLILERALQANLETFQSVSCHFILPIYRSPQR